MEELKMFKANQGLLTNLSDVIKATYSYEEKEISIQDWIEIILGKEYKNVYSDEYCRRAENIFSIFMEKILLTQENENNDDYEDLSVLSELRREKNKIREEKNKLSEIYRWQARNEIYQEKIIEAISNLTPIKIETPCFNSVPKIGNTALLCLSDFHAGSTFEVKGLCGEIINKYDFDIMKKRLWTLAEKISDDNIVYDNMVVAILGDAFENVLRLSSLAKLREPVLDTVIKFSEFMSCWIAELQKNIGVPIKVVCVGGNHDVQRLLGEKPSLEEENLMKIVVEFLKLRLKDCEYIEIADYSDTIIENIKGVSILFEHGEDKDLTTTINYFENLYGIKIDEIYSGHYHCPEVKTIGLSVLGDRQINRVGSICGLDPYSKKIRKAAKPSAYIALYSQEGKGWNKTIYL